MAFDQVTIERRIAQALATRGLDDEVLHDVVFHMTDWLADLEALNAFYSEPESTDPSAAEELLVGFLIHVPNHVAAAAKLLLDFPVKDIFQVGAVDMTLDEKVKQLRLHLEFWGEHREPTSIEYPSDSQIAQALQSLDGEELFGASIGLHNNYYLLVNRCPEVEDCCFKWNAGASDEEYTCTTRNPPIEHIIRAFQQFAKGNHGWKQDFEWQRM